jgi:hypothetical protein
LLLESTTAVSLNAVVAATVVDMGTNSCSMALWQTVKQGGCRGVLVVELSVVVSSAAGAGDNGRGGSG